MADFYEILGVNRDASESDIKKAFKKAAVKYHPDRQAGKSDSEKKAAEEKFKEINEAYDVLSDPQKKSNYDRFGSADGGPSGGFSGFGGFSDIFNMFAGRHRGGNPFQQTKEPGESIQVQIPINIEDFYKGVNKDIDIDINVRCSNCDGAGGEGVEDCPYCHGTGMITETRSQGWMTSTVSRPCNHCGGSGKTVKKKCSECNGTGFKKQHKKISVHFNAGVQEGDFKQFSGQGSESKHKGMPAGDVIVVPVHVFDKKKYRVVGKNIYELVEIPYYDCIVGAHKKHTLPDGNIISYDIMQDTKDGDIIPVITRNNNGLSYYIVVKVKLANKTRKTKEDELLKEIQKLYEKN